MAKNFTIYDTAVAPSIFSNMKPLYVLPEYIDPKQTNYLSRYSMTDRIIDKDLNVTYHETYYRRLIPETNEDTYITVSEKNADRLDIIANEQYQYSLYWWVIAIANDIIDPFNIPAGTVLRIPPLSSLYLDGSVLAE